VQVVVDYVALRTVRRAYFWANWVQGKDRQILLKQLLSFDVPNPV
jgi:hypothetical protein